MNTHDRLDVPHGTRVDDWGDSEDSSHRSIDAGAGGRDEGDTIHGARRGSVGEALGVLCAVAVDVPAGLKR